MCFEWINEQKGNFECVSGGLTNKGEFRMCFGWINEQKGNFFCSNIGLPNVKIAGYFSF